MYIYDSNVNHPYELKEKYLIRRTVTLYYVGVLEAVYDKELVLSTASWIADTRRYSVCLEKGTFSKVEPIIGDVIIGRDAIMDCVKWNHDLPIEAK